ncbi:unnamed protein product, partial [Heterotrigona itama]
VYVGLSELFCRLHDADKSARYAARAYDLSRSLQLGDLNSRHHRAALLQMAAALRKKGELGDAHDYCSVGEATRLSLVSGDQASYARSIRIMGDIYRKKSDINKAFRQYESAMGSAAATGDRLCQMEAMDGAARCLEALRLQHKICNCRPLEFNTRLLEVAGSFLVRTVRSRLSRIYGSLGDEEQKAHHERLAMAMEEDLELRCGGCNEPFGLEADSLEALPCSHILHARCAYDILKRRDKKKKRLCPDCHKSVSSRLYLHCEDPHGINTLNHSSLSLASLRASSLATLDDCHVTSSNSGLEDGLECPFEEDDLGEEEEYDALNDETFGSEATIGDWEKDHEKLAEITESSRHQSTLDKKNVIDTNIEDNLSHLVLDEKEGIIPRPGVWDSPSNLALPKPRPPLTLPSTLTNVCTVEQLEKGLIANRAPPKLNKPIQTQQQQQQPKDGSLLFESLSAAPRFPPGLGIPPPHPVVLPPNMRFPHPQFLQHPRLLPNQTGNVLRYPIAAHYAMLPHTPQRQPIHGSFCNNFPQPPLSNLCPPPFLRADHSIIPPFSSNQSGHQQQQHSFSHSGNQRNQNRAFHHGEQQGNHQPFFKNNQYHRNHDRNNQRHYHYNHHCQGINGVIGSGEPYDDYAGLMSSREKQWLINIQLLQLNTNEPYVDDYYYIVFCDRRNRQSINQEQKDKKQHNNNNNNSYHRDTRDREQPHHVLSKSAYTPTQFENSLGKLQYASVIAPRKVIDMDVVPNSDPQLTTQIQQKDTKRTRQLLLEIERLYIIQLKLEDLHNPLALLSEQNQQQNQEGETEANSHKKSSSDLISMMLSAFLQLIHDDKIASMLSIRKGKTLLLRFLPYLNVTEHRNQLEELWNAIFRGLAIIGRRDSHLLISLHSEFQRWFDTVHEFGTMLRLARSLSDSVSQPIKNNSLAFALTNKFGVSVIASMFEQAEKLYPTDDSLSSEWSSFIVHIIEIIGETPPCVAPCRPIAANTLNQHLNRLSHLKCGRYTTLELLLTDANPSR